MLGIISHFQVVALGATKYVIARTSAEFVVTQPAVQGVISELAKQQVGAAQFGSFSFVDLQKTAPDSYSMITAAARLFVGAADMAGIEDTPTMVVPPMYKLRPHLGPAASFSIADDDGYYLRSVEPFPGSGMFAVGTTGGWASLYAMVLPALAVRGVAETAPVIIEPEELER